MGVKAYIVMPSNSPEVKSGGQGLWRRDYRMHPYPTSAGRYRAGSNGSDWGNIPPPLQRLGRHRRTRHCDHGIDRRSSRFGCVDPPGRRRGLSSGAALAAHLFSPKTKVIGAEPHGADDAWRSLETGKIFLQTAPNTIADGLRTNLGDKTFAVLSQYMERIILVEEQEIVDALRLLMERMKIVVEPSGAVPLAAPLKEKGQFTGQKVGILLSGGNVDLKQLGQLFG
ncbi:MAG: pyridoxal-phosphate dependent enzyme [Saprospiraceae bacterium]